MMKKFSLFLVVCSLMLLTSCDGDAGLVFLVVFGVIMAMVLFSNRDKKGTNYQMNNPVSVRVSRYNDIYRMFEAGRKGIYMFEMSGIYGTTDEELAVARTLEEFDPVFLEIDPDNKSSVRITTISDIKVGYVPDSISGEIAEYMKQDVDFDCFVTATNKDYEEFPDIHICINGVDGIDVFGGVYKK